MCTLGRTVLSAVELRAAFAARELSPVEALESVHARSELGAFVTLDLEAFRSGRLNEAAGIAPAPGLIHS